MYQQFFHKQTAAVVALLATNVNLLSVDAREVVIQSPNNQPIQASECSHHHIQQNHQADKHPHPPVIKVSDTPVIEDSSDSPIVEGPEPPLVVEEDSQIKVKIMDHLQEKLGQVVKGMSPDLVEEDPLGDSTEETPDDAVDEVVSHQGDTLLDSILGSIMHDAIEHIKPNTRRGDVVFEDEDNGDGEKRYHHYQGEPEAIKENIAETAEEASEQAEKIESVISKILGKLKLLLPLDWDVDYLTDDSDLEHNIFNGSMENEDGQEKDDVEAEAISEEEEHNDGILSRVKSTSEKLSKIQSGMFLQKRDTKEKSTKGNDENEEDSATEAETLLKQLKADRAAFEKERSLFEEQRRAVESKKRQPYEQAASANAEALLKQVEADRKALEKERLLFEEQKRANGNQH
ncbi:hypothetical protein BGZ46_002636 [Entomortierella lignicola]|nr:hypothetical protein BGZ46_002636 [Entomortierella lignicola]